MEPADQGRGIGIVGAAVGIVVVAIAIAVVWTILAGLLGLIWLGVKIAVVIGVVVVALVLLGMARTHIFKR